MYAFGVLLRGFSRLPHDAQARVVGDGVELLTAANEGLFATERWPRLYESGVRYKRDEPGREQWRDADEVKAEGFGSCRELAAWRIAELRTQGEAARSLVIPWTGPDGSPEFHVRVLRGDGLTVEDPSTMLGME